MAFKLPSITSVIPRDLRSFCDRVREALDGKGNDRIITRRDLIATGVVVVGPGNTLQPTDPTEIAKVKYDTPPAPTGLATSGAIANIILTWDAPKYVGHSYTEVYVSDTNTFTSRVKLADVPGSIYSHSVGAATTKYYWIRFVNVVEVPGPYNSTTGVSGTTGSDPAYLLSVLTGSITSSELSTALNTEITTNTTEITNVRNLYMVKMDNNGFLTGFGLMSTLADGGVATSDFFTNVNRFAVTAPMTTMPLWTSGTSFSVGQSVRISGTTTKILVCKVAGTSGGSAPSISGAVGSIVTDNTVKWQISSSVPFAVLSTSLTANGVTLAPGVYIDGASIVNATIGSAQIGLATIDDARITDLNAVKITAGSLQVGSYIQSSNFITGVQGWKIDAAGSVEFGSGTFRGALSGATGTFSGSLSAVSGTFTGRLQVGSGGTPGGYVIEITAANVMHVDDFFAASIAAKDIALLNNVSFTIVDATNQSSSATGHALRARNTNVSYGSSGLVGPARADFDFYAEGHGAYGPFTGSHDGLILKTQLPTPGDILVDGDILFRKGISDATSEVLISTQPNQSAIGVYVSRQTISDGFYIASAIVDIDEKGNPIPSNAFLAMAGTHDVCGVNSVGEGLINVCGDNGNISKGDLIVTSSLPGKGMKQSDDIVRAVTVAKSRESVTFASPTEVKQIACIYLCG